MNIEATEAQIDEAMKKARAANFEAISKWASKMRTILDSREMKKQNRTFLTKVLVSVAGQGDPVTAVCVIHDQIRGHWYLIDKPFRQEMASEVPRLQCWMDFV